MRRSWPFDGDVLISQESHMQCQNMLRKYIQWSDEDCDCLSGSWAKEKRLIVDRKRTEAQNKTVSIQPPPPPPPPTVCSLHSVVAPQRSLVVSRHHRQSPSPCHVPHPLRVGQIGQGGSQNYSENLQECVCNGVCGMWECECAINLPLQIMTNFPTEVRHYSAS